MSLSRIVRIVIGLALIGYGVYSQNSLFYVGVIPLIMGLLDICPRKILSQYFGKEECCEGGSCCSADTEDKNSCCSVPKSDTQTKWSTTKENISCCSSDNQEGAMVIEILGTGCAKCISLQKVVNEIVAKIDKPIQVKKVEDINEIMSYNVVSTPGLVINGKVLSTGKLLTSKEVENFINEA